MADQTGISWCDVTFNPWIGCVKMSPACAHCYAETLAEGRMGLTGEKSVWGADAPRRVTADSTWKKPAGWNRDSAAQGRTKYGGTSSERVRVFCASMADVFEERADLEHLRARLFALIWATPALDWLILTKRPDFARAWLFDFYMRCGRPREWVSRDGIGWGVLPNVWIGASIENQAWTWRADSLREIPAAVRFVSAEPLLSSLLTASSRPARPAITGTGDDDALERAPGARGRVPLDLSGIDWLIAGGESGGRASRPMHPEWAHELADACAERQIAFHFKQWGSWGPAGAGTYPGDVCWSLDPEYRYVVGDDYVCAPNESDGAWIRYHGPGPKASGKLLDGVEYCDFPSSAVYA